MRRSTAQYENARSGHAGGGEGKRKRGDDDNDSEDDDDDKDGTPGGEESGRAEMTERDAPPAQVERSDTAGTSTAAEASHGQSPPRVPVEASPVTLQSLHDLLLEERAARLEERAVRQRFEAILLQERVAAAQERDA